MTTTPNPQSRALELLEVYGRLTFLPTYNHADLSVELRAALDRETAALAEVERLKRGDRILGWIISEGYTLRLPHGGRKVDPELWRKEVEALMHLRFYGDACVAANAFARIDIIGQNGNEGLHYPQAQILSQSLQQVGDIAVSFTVGRIVGDGK